MSRRYFTAAAAILVAACSDSPTQLAADRVDTDSARSNSVAQLGNAAASINGANTTVVCHTNGESGKMTLLDINANALGAHIAHGDFQAGSARLLADGYLIDGEGVRYRGPFPHEYWIEVTCDGFEGTGQFPTGSQNPSVTEVIRGTYDGSTMTFRSDYNNDFYWYEYGPGPANGTGPGNDFFNFGDLEIVVSLTFN